MDALLKVLAIVLILLAALWVLGGWDPDAHNKKPRKPGAEGKE